MNKNKFVLRTAKILFIFAVSVLIVFPNSAIKVRSVYNYAPLKIFVIARFGLLIDTNILRVQKLLKIIHKNVLTFTPGPRSYGLPRQRLVEFIFHNKGFPFSNFIKQFQSNVGLYKKIGDDLERLGVLRRGEKNARVLSYKYDAQETLELLDQQNAVFPSLKKVGEGSYNFKKGLQL